MGAFPMADVHGWHASPRRGVPASRNKDNGEIRVPLALFHLDQQQGDIELVLSRVEGEQLYAALSRLLNPYRAPSAGLR